jgi:hypothetical protein
MDSFLSDEVRAGLQRAHTKALRRKNRMRVQSGNITIPILREWDGGFATDIEDAPVLRGRVDIYDGSKHLYQCLVIFSAREGNEMIYEYKRHTPAEDRRIVDYDEPDDKPVALIPGNP